MHTNNFEFSDYNPVYDAREAGLWGNSIAPHKIGDTYIQLWSPNVGWHWTFDSSLGKGRERDVRYIINIWMDFNPQVGWRIKKIYDTPRDLSYVQWHILCDKNLHTCI